MGERARIGIVLASREELEAARPALELLDRLGCGYETRLGSPWVGPERLLRWATLAEQAGIEALLVTAGAAPQLPGMLAAACALPVIALPLGLATFSDGEAMQLALATAATAPVAAVEPGAAERAALLLLRIVAAGDEALRGRLAAYQRQLVREEEERNREALEEFSEEALGDDDGAAGDDEEAGEYTIEEIRPRGGSGEARLRIDADDEEDEAEEWDRDEEEPEPQARFIDDETLPVNVRPLDFNRPLSGPVVGAREATGAGSPPDGPGEAVVEEFPAPRKQARRLGRRRIDPDSPDADMVEQAVDCLLEGGVIAFPTDTVYGLAADATNAAAVELLQEIKGRPGSRAISLMVDSPKLLASIACNLTTDVRRLMEAFWPGPLTILFRKRAGNFTHVSPGESIPVRLPDHSVPLAIMQALARPLAFASAGLGGAEPMTADEVAESLGDRLHLILDGGSLPQCMPTTVLDVTEEPYKVLRQGGVSNAQIAAIVGELLAGE